MKLNFVIKQNIKILFCLLIVMDVILLFILMYQKTKYSLQNNDYLLLKDKVRKTEKFYSEKQAFKGKNLSEIGLLTKEEFDLFIIEKRLKLYKMIVVFDSVTCPACYEFHKRQITNIIGDKNVIIIHKNKNKLLFNDFRSAELLFSHSNIKNYYQLILIIDINGKIIDADLPSYGFYDLSKRFYKAFNKLIMN